MKGSPPNFARRGFTLTEAAIVLGIVGIVLGGIWTAAGTVYENNRVAQAITDFTLASNAIEAMGPGAMDTTNGQSDIIGNGYYYVGAMTTAFMNAGVFPEDMVDKTVNAVVNPWQRLAHSYPNAVVITIGTYVPVYGYTLPAGDPNLPPNPNNPAAGAKIDAFEILFNGMPTSACIKLASWFGGALRDPHIVSILVNSWDHALKTFPVNPSMVSQYCNPANNQMGGPASGGAGYFNGNNSIDVVYKFSP